MYKPLALALAALVVASTAAPEAFAQRGADAKARGDMRPFWSTRSQRNANRNVVAMPIVRAQQPTAESYRSFSFVPAAPSFAAGDEAVVTGNDAKMMRGSDEVATIPSGSRFTVTKVVGGWLGAVIELDGKTSNGWIRNSDAALAANSSAEASAIVQTPAEVVQSPAPTPSVQEYRNFSYQPSQVIPRSSRGAKKHPWQYPKGDSHRYRP